MWPACERKPIRQTIVYVRVEVIWIPQHRDGARFGVSRVLPSSGAGAGCPHPAHRRRAGACGLPTVGRVTSTEPVPARARIRLGAGGVIVIVLLALAVTAGIGMLRGSASTEVLDAPPPSAAPGEPTVTDGHIFVHVSGAVVEPGLYRLAAGTRAFDAVTAAGGFADDADAGAVNLARTIDDGEQLHIPVIGEVPVSAAPGAGTAPGGKIDLNTADLATLDTLPRVGPAIAQRIIDWREANGRFTSVDDLLGVPGIGDKMLAGIRELVSV